MGSATPSRQSIRDCVLQVAAATITWGLVELASKAIGGTSYPLRLAIPAGVTSGLGRVVLRYRRRPAAVRLAPNDAIIVGAAGVALIAAGALVGREHVHALPWRLAGVFLLSLVPLYLLASGMKAQHWS